MQDPMNSAERARRQDAPLLPPDDLAQLVSNAILDIIVATLKWGAPNTGAKARRAAQQDGFYKARLAIGHMGSLAEQGYVYNGIATAHDDAATQWVALRDAIRTDIGPPSSEPRNARHGSHASTNGVPMVKSWAKVRTVLCSR